MLSNIAKPAVGGVAGLQYTLVSEVHSKNAEFPIEVTLLGIVTLASDQQS